MKKALLCFVLLGGAPGVGFTAPMSRVVAVTDSRTIVVETKGVRSAVVLTGVGVLSEEEMQAATYLRRTLSNAWVYVENGDVYRSPDGLYINGEMLRHAWRSGPPMTYLGELDLGVRAKNLPPGNRVGPPPALPPPQTAKPARRATGASRSGSRRTVRAQ